VSSLEEHGGSVDKLEMCSMIWFAITDEKTDQSDQAS